MIDDRQVLTGEINSSEDLNGDFGNTIIVNGGKVNDVLVNGTSVVENKVANVVVPTDLKDLNDDSTHRVVTDSEKTIWNNKSDFSGNYEDLTNKPDLSIFVDNTELEESQSIQDEKIDLNSMVYNALPQITGNNDVIIGTSNTPIKLELEGNCYQEDEPSPDNPQVVHVVTGNNTINVLSKNLFDKTATLGGWVRALDGTVLEQYTDIYNYTPFIKVDSNTTYTLDLYNSSNLGSAGVCEYSSNTQSSFIKAVNENQRYITFTTDVNTKYIRFTVRVDSKDFVMLEKGSTTTEYASYQSQTYPITLGNLEYCKIENNKDEFIKATNEIGLTSGKWYLKKNIDKSIVDSTNYAERGTTGTNAYYIGLNIETPTDNNAILCMSNMFQPISFANRNNGLDVTYSQNGYIKLRTANNTSLDWSDATNCRNWLDTNKPIVYHSLTTPEYILLNDTLQTELNNIQAAVSYNGQTNLMQINDDLPFTINYNANKNVFTKTSELTNDSGFITNTVSNLTNYYTKNETYTKNEVNGLTNAKQDTLVSGTNIKTINNESILGSGNINIQGGGSTIQYDVMPTPSLEFINKIIQYTGTNGTYKNGYFYKCKSNTIPSKIITTGASLLPLNIHIDNHKFELKFKPTTLDGWHKLMATEEDGYGAIILTNESTAIFGIDGDYYYQYDIDWQSENLYTALYNGDDGMFGINGTTVDSITSYDNTYYLNLFASNSENMDEAYKGEFYGLKVWDKTNDELIMNLVPSQNNNTPALYDTINQTYYYDNYSSMTYVAGGTTYYWERVDIQPSSNITGLDFTWENSWQKINASDKLLGQFLDIVNNYNENILKPYSLGSYLLSSVSMQGQDQGSDYTAFELAFEKIEDRNDKKRYIYFYANYDQTEIYDSEDVTYYPKTGSEQATLLASSDDFLNYLSKYNADEYVPISDFNPATKAYADSVINNCAVQYTNLPTPDESGKVVQYIGATGTYHKNYFYQMAPDTSTSTKILRINDESSFALNYEFQDTDKLEIKFKPYMESPEDSGIIGNEEDTSELMEIHFYGTNIYIGAGYEEHSFEETYSQNTVYTIVLNNDNDIIINDEIRESGISFGTGGTLKLFDYQSNKDFRGDFYYLRIYDKTTGNLKKEWIPALDQNDVPCIYESVGETYIYNTETPSTPNEYLEIYDNYYWERADVQPSVDDKIVTLTQTEYDNLVNKDSNTYYFIIEQ